MVQLIKKGGLRERANRSRSYQGSENTKTTLKPNRYQTAVKTPDNLASPSPTSPISPALNEDTLLNSSE
jgi:hypothetical protein